MNDLLPFDGKTMTVQQVADALGIPERTIHNSIDRVLPGLKKNGVTTYLDPEMVAMVSKDMKRAHNSELASSGKVAITSLEMAEKAREVMAWLMSEADRMREELALAAPKIESFNALQRSEETMSITQAAKHFGLHPKTHVFPYLRAMKYLTIRDLPAQSAIDAGYLALREAECSDGEFRPQAVVLASQLEAWRIRVVPQIKAWEALP